MAGQQKFISGTWTTSTGSADDDCSQLIAVNLNGVERRMVSEYHNRRKGTNDMVVYKEIEMDATLMKDSTSSVASALEAIGITDTTKNDDLFTTTSPPPPRQECPICMLPMPIPPEETTYMQCCGKKLCNACLFGHRKRIAVKNERREAKKLPPITACCAFCRKALPTSTDEELEDVRKRMDLNDSGAFATMAGYYAQGQRSLKQNHRKAYKLCLRATELGSANACYHLANMYENGTGVTRDKKKYEHYLEIAAKRGDVYARHSLGQVEMSKGNHHRAMAHLFLSASAGYSVSVMAVEFGFRSGFVDKEEYADILRAQQKANDEMKSEERDKYAKYKKKIDAAGIPYSFVDYLYPT